MSRNTARSTARSVPALIADCFSALLLALAHILLLCIGGMLIIIASLGLSGRYRRKGLRRLQGHSAGDPTEPGGADAWEAVTIQSSAQSRSGLSRATLVNSRRHPSPCLPQTLPGLPPICLN